MSKPVGSAEPTALGIRLKAIRESAGINASELSRAIGGSKSLVWHIECGLILEPSYATMARLAEALGTTERYLAFGDGAAPSAEDCRAAFIRASVDRAGKVA